MKILHISDLHGRHLEVFEWILYNIDSADYDVVVASGDLWEGTSINPVNDWIEFQKTIGTPIIVIQGNHDYFDNTVFDNTPDIHLLHNESVEIDGVKFFGTPYTVSFCGWNWMNSEESLYEMWHNLIPDNIDVLISHGPPHGHCDNCNQHVHGNDENSHLGSKALYAIIFEKSPKIVLCGHIHSSDRESVMTNGVKIYNGSCLDEAYKFLGYNDPPRIVEL